MKREYSQQNVYDALQDRLKFIFEEFDNIYLSFSGGKDSGLLLNLVLDFQQKYYPSKKSVCFTRILKPSIQSQPNTSPAPSSVLRTR